MKSSCFSTIKGCPLFMYGVFKSISIVSFANYTRVKRRLNPTFSGTPVYMSFIIRRGTKVILLTVKDPWLPLFKRRWNGLRIRGRGGPCCNRYQKENRDKKKSSNFHVFASLIKGVQTCKSWPRALDYKVILEQDIS